jgi:hypothetical protein
LIDALTCAAALLDAPRTGTSVALAGVRSGITRGLVTAVLLAIARPAGPDRVTRDPAACAAWQRQYQNACVVPSGKLAHHDDPAAYDARRVLSAGCDAIAQRAAPACSARPFDSPGVGG